MPFLGEIPLDPPVAEAGDAGEPVVIASPDSPASKAFHEVTARVAAQLEGASVALAPLPSLG